MSQPSKRAFIILPDLQRFCDLVVAGGDVRGVESLHEIATLSIEQIDAPGGLTLAIRQKLIKAGSTLARIYGPELARIHKLTPGRRGEEHRKLLPTVIKQLTDACASDGILQRSRLLAHDTFYVLLGRDKVQDPSSDVEALGPETVPARRTTAPRSMGSAASA